MVEAREMMKRAAQRIQDLETALRQVVEENKSLIISIQERDLCIEEIKRCYEKLSEMQQKN